MQEECVSFTVDGQTYKLKYDFNLLCEAEHVSGFNMLPAVSGGGVMSAGACRALLYAYLKSDRPGITIEKCGDLISADRNTVMAAIGKALNGNVGDAPKEQEN